MRTPADHHGLVTMARRTSGSPWTAAEDDALRRLRREGVPTAEIAARLRRSESAVTNRAFKLGLLRGDVPVASVAQPVPQPQAQPSLPDLSAWLAGSRDACRRADARLRALADAKSETGGRSGNRTQNGGAAARRARP